MVYNKQATKFNREAGAYPGSALNARAPPLKIQGRREEFEAEGGGVTSKTEKGQKFFSQLDLGKIFSAGASKFSRKTKTEDLFLALHFSLFGELRTSAANFRVG
jgi:hypothetical protein